MYCRHVRGSEFGLLTPPLQTPIFERKTGFDLRRRGGDCGAARCADRDRGVAASLVGQHLVQPAGAAAGRSLSSLRLARGRRENTGLSIAANHHIVIGVHHENTTIIILAASSVLHAADNDGDLLLDSWEAAYGISTNRFDTTGHGIGDYFDDPDHDGLPNHAERTAGTDPTNSCTFGGIPNDYYAVTNSSTIGAVLTDNDHLEDFWESRHTPAVSMHVGTRHPTDGDWDAWSERGRHRSA